MQSSEALLAHTEGFIADCVAVLLPRHPEPALSFLPLPGQQHPLPWHLGAREYLAHEEKLKVTFGHFPQLPSPNLAEVFRMHSVQISDGR